MELRTERLILRKLTVDDADAITALADDWDVAKVLARVPYPYTREDACTWIGLVIEEDQPAWGICTDRLVGVVGTEDHLGYWLGKKFWGMGYATEAASAALGFHFSDAKNADIHSGHFPDNTASRHVLNKLGFVESGLSEIFSVAHKKTIPHVDMLLTRENWETRVA